jgi:hypothetical protein
MLSSSLWAEEPAACEQPFSSLPVAFPQLVDELWIEVLSQLGGSAPAASVGAAAAVSRHWHKLATDGAVWQKVYQRMFQTQVFAAAALPEGGSRSEKASLLPWCLGHCTRALVSTWQ